MAKFSVEILCLHQKDPQQERTAQLLWFREDCVHLQRVIQTKTTKGQQINNTWMEMSNFKWKLSEGTTSMLFGVYMRQNCEKIMYESKQQVNEIPSKSSYKFPAFNSTFSFGALESQVSRCDDIF
jgi:hypothetical protein